MNKQYIDIIVKSALVEDIGQGDITSNSLVPIQAQAMARLLFKSEGIVCGLDLAQSVFRALNAKINFKKLVQEGQKVKKGQAVALIQGSGRSILTAERVAINFLTHCSSIATRTRAFVDAIKPYPSKIYDTRKTTPLLRELERYAVRVGGGYNHRFDLSSMAMIKDNHRMLWGKRTLKEAVRVIKTQTKKNVVLEVDTWDELEDALTSKADVILLDNMTPARVRKAVVLRNQLRSKVLLEASGGIGLDQAHVYAKTGVERISIGSLTSVKQRIDISLDFIV